MDLYRIAGHRYYQFGDIAKTHPSLMKGCRKSKDEFLKHHGIPDTAYIHAREIDGEWTITNGKSKKYDKTFILMRYFQKHLVTEAVEYPQLPDELELEEEEMFHDQDGEPLVIKVVGERTVNGIYFCAKDVSEAFGIGNLVSTIRHRDHKYEEGIHYSVFAASSRGQGITYLTYTGILKVLFSSRNQVTQPFISWATETLFVAQMGTTSMKRELASTLLGVSPANIKQWCKTTAGDTPCIYLYQLGTVKDLRKSMGISDQHPDSSGVYKLGQTGNLSKRTGQHVATFKKIKNCDLQLIYHAYIDPRYVCQAETMIKDTATDMGVYLEYQNATELIVLSKKQLTRFKKQYDRAFSLYRGCVGDLTDRVREQDHTIQLMQAKHEAEILRYQLAAATK